jgi:penicillin-binding protein 1A
MMDAGIDNVIQRLRRMGMKGEIERIPSVALGTAEVTLLELVSAYTTFLNRGNYRPSFVITRIEDQDGNVLEEFNPEPTTGVFSAETCGIMNQMLANVVDRGTGAMIRYDDLDIRGAFAGKTGTTQFHSDGLFVGYSPKFLAGAWVGCFDRRISFNSLRDGMGSKTALPMWGEFVKKLQADPTYKPLFNSYWPAEYKWVNDCPWTMEESQLVELGLEPGVVRDSTYTGPRKFAIKDDQRKGIGKLIQDIFGKKEEKTSDQ